MAKRFHAPQGLQELRRNLVKRDFGVEIENRFEVRDGQALAGIGIEMGSQIGQPPGRQGETDSMGVSAIAREKIATRFNRIQ